jgi:hypothetical protein
LPKYKEISSSSFKGIQAFEQSVTQSLTVLKGGQDKTSTKFRATCLFCTKKVILYHQYHSVMLPRQFTPTSIETQLDTQAELSCSTLLSNEDQINSLTNKSSLSFSPDPLMC